MDSNRGQHLLILRSLQTQQRRCINLQRKKKEEEEKNLASITEGLFSSHTRRITQDCFRQELLDRLPPAILAIILPFIGPCWYLIVLGESGRLLEQVRNSRGNVRTISFFRDIYITRIEYQGVSYISRISNTKLPSQVGLSEERLHLPPYTQKMMLSMDHIGIRRLQFLDSETDLSPDDSPWHEIVEARYRCDGCDATRNVSSSFYFDAALYIIYLI